MLMIAFANPDSLQPATSRCARCTCHGAMPSDEAACPLGPRKALTFAMVRILLANAATIGTGASPVARACRSSTIAGADRPARAMSATLNAFVSTRPP